MMIRVKNLQKIDEDEDVSRNELENWNNIFGLQGKCSNIDCNNQVEHGTRVKKVGFKDKTEYIIPLCPKCDKRYGEEFDVFIDTHFMKAELLYN